MGNLESLFETIRRVLTLQVSTEFTISLEDFEVFCLQIKTAQPLIIKMVHQNEQ